MRVVIVGCGRVGAGLATSLADASDRVTVIDKDPKAFERLGEDFAGQTVEGIGFDRDVLELAGIASADALVAVTSGDNSNVVAARVARDAYRVPRVIARIHDPRRAAIYEELGVVTVSSVAWALRKVVDYLEHRTLKDEGTFAHRPEHRRDGGRGHRRRRGQPGGAPAGQAPLLGAEGRGAREQPEEHLAVH